MANCEENTEAAYLQRGSYNFVSRVKGIVKCAEFGQGDVQELVTKSFISKLFSKGTQGLAEVSTMTSIAMLSHNILIHHQIGDPDIARLDKHSVPNTADSRLIIGQYLGNIVDVYMDIERDRIKQSAIGVGRPKYTLGLSLSDTMEVLPVGIAARILLAASDPDIARTIVKAPRKNSAEQRVDPQPYAVEAVALLPNDTRHALFEEMARLSPGINGGARRLLSLIASNWSNYNSPFCARESIYRSLEEDQSGEKVLEVQDDLRPLGQLIEGYDKK